MNKQKFYKEIVDGVTQVFKKDLQYSYNFHVEVYLATDLTVNVTVSQMYEFLPLTFQTLMELSEVFGTKEFTVNNWSSAGCETCDFGSKYTHEFSYKLKTEE